MKRLALMGIIVIAMAACAPEPEPVQAPAYIIPDDSLVAILTEVHMAGATYQHRDVRRNRLQDFARAEYYHVFDSFNISQDRLDSSLVYYKRDPQHLEVIYDEVLNNLSTRLAEAKAEAKPSAKDSMNLEDGSAEEAIEELNSDQGRRIKGTQLPEENKPGRAADTKRQRSL